MAASMDLPKEGPGKIPVRTQSCDKSYCNLLKGMVALVLLTVLMVTAFLLILAYRIHPVAGVILEMIMTYQILAAKCLKVESMKVYKCLKENDLIAARHAVSMIVGRDTGRLDETGVSKAAKMKITFILISYHGIHRIDCLIKKAKNRSAKCGI